MNRFVVNEAFLHQRSNKSPADLSPAPFSQNIESGEQPVQREFEVGEGWEPLPLQWLANAPLGQLVVECTGPKYQVIPTPEERAEAESKILYLGIDGAVFAKVRPGASCRFEPVGNITVKGPAKGTVTAVPA
jgi:hypothetical protein